MFRFKDILCEVSELEFMMNDKEGTVVSHDELCAFNDDDLWKDLEAASEHFFAYVTILGEGQILMEMLPIEEALIKYGRTNNC